MINKEKVIKLVKEILEDNMFLVDVSVSDSNAIRIFVDSFEGLPIEKCVNISRHVEHSLDRDEEDFELQVSSPGLTESFRVKEQYIKNEGREVELIKTSGEKLKGILKKADDNNVIVESSSREKTEGHKKKQLIVREHIISYDEIKTAKVVISFK